MFQPFVADICGTLRAHARGFVSRFIHRHQKKFPSAEAEAGLAIWSTSSDMVAGLVKNRFFVLFVFFPQQMFFLFFFLQCFAFGTRLYYPQKKKIRVGNKTGFFCIICFFSSTKKNMFFFQTQPCILRRAAQQICRLALTDTPLGIPNRALDVRTARSTSSTLSVVTLLL